VGKPREAAAGYLIPRGGLPQTKGMDMNAPDHTAGMSPAQMRAYLAGLSPDQIHTLAERVMRSRVKTEELRRQLRTPKAAVPAEAVMGELELIEIEARLRKWWRAIGQEYRDRLTGSAAGRVN
jgi:23S rRNA maturation mini-RNase III